MGDDDSQTERALCRVMEECLHHPGKKKDFIHEGTLELLLELCRSHTKPVVKAYAAATMAVLCHQNNSAKVDVLRQGGSKTLLSLCRPLLDDNNNGSTRMDKLLCHQQSAAVLQKLTYENPSCQAELVNAGVIRHLVQLCDVFTPNSNHSNCCQATFRYTKEANELFSDLTMNKKLIGNVVEMNCNESVRKIENLVQSGAEIHCLGEELSKVYSIDLYDTTTDKDIRISNELKAKGLVWPDLSYIEEVDKAEERESPRKEAMANAVWSDVTLMQVIDAGHFWGHVGGEAVKKNISEIQDCLKSQELVPLPDMPHTGSLVCTQEIVSGHKMMYRARVLDVSSSGGTSKAKVFAIDFGFVAIVPGDMVYAVPTSLNRYPAQVSLCCLSGVQPLPKHAAILEYTAGALRNLCEVNEDFISYIATSGGIEALLKLCLIPNKRILLQALGAITNIALDFRYRARIGYLGGIKILLNLCLQYGCDEDILMLTVGAIQSTMVNSLMNRSRVAEAQGLAILIHVYINTKKEELRHRTLRALKNFIGKQNGEVVRSKNTLDLKSVMDESPSTQKRFSMSIANDDGYSHRAPTRTHRRRERRKDLADPKPTHMSLSLDCLEKATSDISDAESASDDSDDRYAGRWTSETDGDTDGEMLIKDGRTAKIPNYTALAESLASDKYYVQTHYMPFNEGETHEFSSQTNVNDISKRKIAKSLCAFLNNKKCGTIYIGVRSNAEICGARVKRKERDLLRLGLDEMVERFKPPIKHDMYKIEFVPIARPLGCESVVTRKLIEDRFVIEITLVKYTGFIYTSPQGKCFFRHKSSNIELTTQEVREKTIQEQETSYNEEIKRLRKELKGMRKQLSERTRVADSTTNTSDPRIEQSASAVILKSESHSAQMTDEYTSHDAEASGCVVM